MSEVLQQSNIAISAGEAGERIDRFLSSYMEDMTRSYVQKLCDEGYVLISGKPVSKNYKLRINDIINITVPKPVNMEAKPENIPLDIAYEDEQLLVVDKPKGMVVHPAAGNYDGTLVNALLYHCGESLSGIGGVARPGIVHRIDKDTSGLLVVAKTDAAHRFLSDKFKTHDIKRRYYAVVYGNVKNDEGTIAAPVGRHSADRKKMCVTDHNSKQAVTHYKVLEHLDGFTYIAAELETGRTHQIRVHMAYIGHPVAGDAVYGPKKVLTSLGGQCLHAGVIGFNHPITGKMMEFTSALPDYFKIFIEKHIAYRRESYDW